MISPVPVVFLPVEAEVCYGETEESCGGDTGETTPYGAIKVILFLSQFLAGIMQSLNWSIGLTYLDDNINKKTYPLYFSE